jgi:hypothetical protein
MIEEIRDLLKLAERYPRYFSMEVVGNSASPDSLAIYKFTLCDRDSMEKNTPALGLFAGFHGIEAIGVKILTVFIDHVLEQTNWNTQVCDLLSRLKIVGIPIVNPGGYVRGSRCNPNGVDLMRNAPVESSQSLPIVGGHRISPRLPYFRGIDGFEPENLCVIDVVEQHLWTAPFSLSLDLHSGFGAEDYLWTPYAREQGYPPHWDSYANIKSRLDSTLKNHVYRFEPQSAQYCTAGDLWDYLFDQSLESFKNSDRIFLPVTLEVGSWVWLKKSPFKIFEIRNLFNPAHSHRERRVLRRHLPLLNLLLNIVADYERVIDQSAARKAG